jgi:ribosomal protein S27AE
MLPRAPMRPSGWGCRRPRWPQRARLEVVPAVLDSGPRVRAGLYLAGGRPLRISGGGLAERARVTRLAPEPAEPGRRSAAPPSRGHDERRRANRFQTGRWCPMAALAAARESTRRESRCEVVTKAIGCGGLDTWARHRTGRGPEMNETCDRCGPAIGAAYRVDRVGELYLCGQCASRQWRALSAQGWTFWPLGVHALAPQASAAPGYGPVEDAA